MSFFKSIYRQLLDQQGEEIARLEREKLNFMIMAGQQEKEDGYSLPDVKYPYCVACAYAHRFPDRDGGYIMKCLRNVSCRGFEARK